ncbi:MAG: lytic transglycosylase domain-containing protein [Nitrospirae bacterium]|nr:lytic transglycosylase domain-containing protein [Nitrospirota bacterium]
MRITLIIALLLLGFSTVSGEIFKYQSDEGVAYFTNAAVGNKDRPAAGESKSSAVRINPKQYAALNKSFFHDIAEEKAREHNIDPELVKAVIKAESNWNPVAVSRKGARGLMQLMPSTAADLGVLNSFNPEENIDGGIRYLKYLLERFNGNLMLALAAYNAGPNLVDRIKSVPAIPETVSYVRRIIRDYSGSGYGSRSAMTAVKGSNGDRIHKIVNKDGTILLTNTYAGKQEL